MARLKTKRFRREPKVVNISPNFKDYRGVKSRPDLQNDFNDIVNRLKAGQALPDRYYRSKIDATGDRLLDEQGIKHLHLGGQNSDVIVYAVEYPGRVEILQINGHIHLESRPRGKQLETLFGPHLRKLEAGAAAATAITAAVLWVLRKRD